MTGIWIYAAVAALHIPGIAILALLMRDLADSDPPDVPEGGPGGGTPHGWRWQGRPRRSGGARPSRSAIVRRRPLRDG